MTTRVARPRASFGFRSRLPFGLPGRSLELAVALAGSLLCGVALGQVSPVLVAVGIVAVAVAVMAFVVFGESAVLGLVFFAVPCIPVIGAAGGAGATLRMVLLGVLASGAALMHLQRARNEPTSVAIPLSAHRVAMALYVMAAIGIGVAAGNASGASEFLKILLKTSGQPLLYAVLFVTLVSALNVSRRAGRAFLIGWALALIVQGAVVAVELASGGAYDPLRNLTRAGGTVGADFLGAFAVMGVFGAMYLRTTERDRSVRLIAIIAAAAGAGALIASVSRGPLIAFGISLVYLLFEAAPFRSGRQALASILAVLVLVGGALYIGRDLWSTRLDRLSQNSNQKSGSSFDRPATWASGVLIAQDHPFTGVGPDGVITAVRERSRYNTNKFGTTRVNPHNSWIFALAEGGFLYGGALVVVAGLFVLAVWRRPRRDGGHYLVAAIISGGTVFFANNLFTHPEIVLYLLLSGAILLSNTHREEEAPARGSLPEPAP